MLERGLIQIYTGEGKGKTTAALGLALRASGHGSRVLVYQFLKPDTLELGERKMLRAHCEDIVVKWLGQPWDMVHSRQDPALLQRMRDAVHCVMRELETAAHERDYDIIVLDEIVFCLSQGLASMNDIRSLIEHRDARVEIVLTGRGASDELIDLADLVTEMRLIKHPYDDGIPAGEGIDY